MRSPPLLPEFSPSQHTLWYAAEGASISIIALEPTAYSVRSCLAPTSGGGSPQALGAHYPP